MIHRDRGPHRPSLNSSSSWSPASCGATEEQRGVFIRRNPQPHPTPFDRVAHTGVQVLDFANTPTFIRRANLDVTKVEPELARTGIVESDRYRHRVLAIYRLLHKPDHIAIVDLGKKHAARLLQGTVTAPKPAQIADVALDVAGQIPIPDLKFVFLGVEILFLTRNGLVLEQFEAVVDSVIAGERRRENGPRFEDPGFA